MIVQTAYVNDMSNESWRLDLLDEMLSIAFDDGVHMIHFFPVDFDTYYIIRDIIRTHSTTELLNMVEEQLSSEVKFLPAPLEIIENTYY